MCEQLFTLERRLFPVVIEMFDSDPVGLFEEGWA